MKELFYSIPNWVWWVFGIVAILKWLGGFIGGKLDAIRSRLEKIDDNLIAVGKKLDKLDTLDKLEELNDKLGHIERRSETMLKGMGLFDWAEAEAEMKQLLRRK